MNESKNHLSDFLLAIDLFKKSSPVYVNKILVKYCRHNQSTLKKKLENNEQLELIKIFKDKFKKQKNYIDQINFYKIFIYIIKFTITSIKIIFCSN